MSYVTNVILKLPVLEAEKINQINSFFPAHHGFLRGIEEICGGTKVFEQPVYLAAFNYFDLDGFIAHVKSIHWDSPEEIQIFVCGQNDEVFTEVLKNDL